MQSGSGVSFPIGTNIDKRPNFRGYRSVNGQQGEAGRYWQEERK